MTIRNLKSQSSEQNAKLVQKGECWTWNQGFDTFWDNILLSEFFDFT